LILILSFSSLFILKCSAQL